MIHKIGDGLQPTAIASDSTIEGLEDNNMDFLIGVQWHPEMMFEKEEEHLKLFRYFIDKVKESMEI